MALPSLLFYDFKYGPFVLNGGIASNYDFFFCGVYFDGRLRIFFCYFGVIILFAFIFFSYGVTGRLGMGT